MKLNRKELVQALDSVKGLFSDNSVEKKFTSRILLIADPSLDFVQLRYRNVSSAMTVKFNAKQEKQERFVIGFKGLYDSLKRFKDKEIILEEDQNKITVSVPNKPIKISLKNIEENEEFFNFIEMENLPQRFSFTYKIDKFIEAITSIRGSVSKDMTRFMFTGICLDEYKLPDGKKELSFITSDGKNLSVYNRLDNKKNVKRVDPMLVFPIKVFDSFLKALKIGTAERVQISVMKDKDKGHNYMTLETDNIKIISEAFDTQFPQYENVIPNKADIAVPFGVDTDRLLEAFKFIKPASLSKYERFSITTLPKESKLSLTSADGVSIKIDIVIKNQANYEKTLYLNLHPLYKFVSAMKKTKATDLVFGINASDASALTIKRPDNRDYLFITMPISIKEINGS